MLRYVLVFVAVVFICPAPVASAERTIVVLGDSPSSGYGMDAEESWAALLAGHLEAQAYGYEVVNASMALNPELMQRDSIYPDAAAQRRIFENVWRVLSRHL